MEGIGRSWVGSSITGSDLDSSWVRGTGNNTQALGEGLATGPREQAGAHSKTSVPVGHTDCRSGGDTSIR